MPDGGLDAKDGMGGVGLCGVDHGLGKNLFLIMNTLRESSSYLSYLCAIVHSSEHVHLPMLC